MKDQTQPAYVNTSPGIQRWHTSAAARAAYTYIPASAHLPVRAAQADAETFELVTDRFTDTADPMVRVKLFAGSWTWYLTEWDGISVAFGLVVGHETELGYVDLDELAEIRQRPFGLPIERDIHFRPTPLSQIRAQHRERAS